jgi:hypothetical protein
MNGLFNPIVIAQAAARNIVPLVGILAFHWSAGNVLILEPRTRNGQGTL